MDKLKIRGNLVLFDRIMNAGILEFSGEKISGITSGGNPSSGCDYPDAWIVPGMVGIHIHGLGRGESKTESGIRAMAEFGPQTGMTAFCPTLAPVQFSEEINYLKVCAKLSANPGPGSSRVLGSHLEGPFVHPPHKGGMAEKFLRIPDRGNIDQILEAAAGSLRLVTLAPELDGMDWMVPLLVKNGVTVSAGHTACPIDRFKAMTELGISLVCHLYDTFAPRINDAGVTQPDLTDEVLIDDRLLFELIPDGIHVPPTLVKLAKRAGGIDRFVGITDSVEGTGLPDGEYALCDGRGYRLKKGDVGRLVENGDIVGSCLTMNMAFYNLVSRFGFTPVEAAKALAANPAKAINCHDRLGKLETGYLADAVAIDPETGDVLACWVNGVEVWKKN